MPFSGDILEALAFGCDSGLLFFPLLLGGINAFGQQTPGLLAPLSGVPERDSGVFPETEQLALTVKAVSHPPQLAAAGGDIEEQAAAVEILAGLHVGFQTANVGIGKRHGHSLVVVGRRDAHMDKNFCIPVGYPCRYQKCRTTFLPTDIPTKCLDASGRGWTSGNRTGSKKERMPMSFGLWHSSLYPNLASPGGFEPPLTA